MAAFFEDTLQGATTLLELWTPDTTGDSWTKLWGDAIGSLQVTATGLRASVNAGDVGLLYTADVTYPSANYESKLTFVGTFSTITPVGLGLRIQDQENLYGLRLVSGTSNAQVYKKVAGVWSTLGSAVTIADGSVVRFAINGSNITVYDDDVAVVEVTDSSISAAGKAGLFHGGGAELITSTDDIRAFVMVHTFSVTELASVGSVSISRFHPSLSISL